MDPDDFAAACSGRLSSLGDLELLSLMRRLAAAERTLSVYALAQLGEIQRRKLHETAGYRSMFEYCVGELRYSEGTAYRRLRAVEAAGKFPEILALIRDGDVTVCALSLVARQLTRENSSSLLKRIEGKSVREVERIATELAPKPDTRDSIRPLSAPRNVLSLDAWRSEPDRAAAEASKGPGAEPTSGVDAGRSSEREAVLPPEPEAVLPPEPEGVHPPEPAAPVGTLAPPAREVPAIPPGSTERFLFTFTGGAELSAAIERLRDLLWHKFPAGRLEDVLLEAARRYLALKDPELRLPSRPVPPRAKETRAVVRWVRSAVYRRDEGRCVFTSAAGRRCEARRGLEYDHILPWARGGRSDDPANIRLLCRAHNQWAARKEGLA